MEKFETQNLETETTEDNLVKNKFKRIYFTLPTKITLASLLFLLCFIFTLFPSKSNYKEVKIPEIPYNAVPFVVKEDATVSLEENDDIKKLHSNEDIDKNKIPQEILNSKILLHTNDQRLYLVSPLDSDKKLILDDVDGFSLSNDKNKIAFTKYGERLNSIKVPFYILDIHSGEIKKYEKDIWAARALFWSPDDKYVMVNGGTGSIGGTTVFLTETGEQTCTFANSPTWINNKEAFVQQYVGSVSMRPWEMGAGTQIAKINIETCDYEIFLKATDTEDFNIEEILQKELVVRKTYVDRVEDWEITTIGSTGDYVPGYKFTYEKYNIKTKEMVPYPDYKSDTDMKEIDMGKLFSDILEYEKIYITENKYLKGWYLLNIYKKGSVFNRDVFVVGPNKEVIFIADNVIAEWF